MGCPVDQFKCGDSPVVFVSEVLDERGGCKEAFDELARFCGDWFRSVHDACLR